MDRSSPRTAGTWSNGSGSSGFSKLVLARPGRLNLDVGVILMKDGFWQRGGSWVLAQSVLMLATLAAAPVWAGDWTGWLSRVAALVLLVLGAVFGISGAVTLSGSRTIFPEPLPRARLVRSGIYGIVRHPLYTSVILLSFAWALWWCSLAGVALALVTTLFLDAKARHEEERLHLRFLDYQGYSRRVKRLIPWIY